VKKILVIGATSAIAEATARIWAQRGDELFLVARNEERLNLVTKDLKVRGAPKVHEYCMDANDFGRHSSMLDKVFGVLGSIDIILIAHGTLSKVSRWGCPGRLMLLCVGRWTGSPPHLLSAHPSIEHPAASRAPC
jgi:NADP-dependent 3-hydroxy acid dehydrogenase YdfG